MSPSRRRIAAILVCALLLIAAKVKTATQAPGENWPVYGGDPGGSKFSPLTQINRSNITSLKVSWTYHTGDMYDPNGKGGRRSALEATPVVVDGTLYLITPFGRVVALDPATGIKRWDFDPKVDIKVGYGDFASRGVSYWAAAQPKDGVPCQRRILAATIDARLFALDAATGQPCADFGDGGQISLRKGLRLPIQDPSEYEETSPPAIAGDLVIVGSAIADNGRTNLPSGEVRAYDVRTGALRWSWDPIPQNASDPGAKTWKDGSAARTGGANAWSIISVDPARKLVFVPTGSASPDYYGGERKGANLYANSVIALHAETGKVAWHFQTVHHDLWDYDVAAQPLLLTIRGTPAVAVSSKTGHLFLLHRETGRPLFPVEERPVPASDVPGEEASPTQPFPTLPKALVPQRMTVEDAWGPTPEDRKACQEQIRALRSEGAFTPPSLRGSVIVPGNIGGMAWGGAAWDPARNLLVLPTNRLVAVVKLIPREQLAGERKARLGPEYAAQRGTPYGMGRQFLLSPSGIPCNAPPWGTLTAIDTLSGQVKWEVPLGMVPFAGKMPGADKAGSPNLGGPLATAGGLVFIGASFDSKLRAFDTETGRELWAGALPTSARATPMTYQANGKQYVVISAGGHEVPGNVQADAVVAFALP